MIAAVMPYSQNCIDEVCKLYHYISLSFYIHHYHYVYDCCIFFIAYVVSLCHFQFQKRGDMGCGSVKCAVIFCLVKLFCKQCIWHR